MAPVLPQTVDHINLIPKLPVDADEKEGHNTLIEIAQLEVNFLEKEKLFLETALNSHQAFITKAQEIITEENNKIEKMLNEKSLIASSYKMSQRSIKNLREIIELSRSKIADIKFQIGTLRQTKMKFAGAISVKELAKISFKDFQDTPNDLFKWVLSAIYGEPRTRYEWNNFKEQVFIMDKGEDFMFRLKATSVKKMSDDDLKLGQAIVKNELTLMEYFSKKGKQNSSIRFLLNYIKTVVQMKELFNQVRIEEEVIKEKYEKIEKVQIETERMNILKKNIEASQHFVKEWEAMQAQSSECVLILQKRMGSF